MFRLAPTLRRGPAVHRSYSGISKEFLPSAADVVVIGGGSIGCSVLYHLAELGITNTVLLEKDSLTAGTTWHTAGLVWNLRPNDTDIQLIQRSIELMSSRLESQTGINTGWINNGGLFIASNKVRMEEYKRLYTIGKVFGIDSHILSPKETKKLYPLMNVDDIYATLYSPRDGTIDPNGWCSALTRVAKSEGAKVIEKCAVLDILTEDDQSRRRVVGVETSSGEIKTGVVVNCAGAWSDRIGRMAGVKVPLQAMKHAYIVTEKIEGIQNMPNVRDHDASVYLKLQGDVLQVGGYELNPIILDDLADDFAFGLYDLNWDVFSSNIKGAINRVPCIETTGVRSTVCGPESFTPDHKPLMGESPEVRGFYLGCAFNSSGMMLAGGCGQQLAQWVVNGRPTIDMYSYDIRRFHPALTGNLSWISQRSHEAYAKNYSVVFPYDEPLASRMMQKDPLYDILVERGCVFQERHGWERPGWFSETSASLKTYDYYGSYGNTKHEQYAYDTLLQQDYTFGFPKHHKSIEAACLTCRNSVALFNMSYFGKIYLFGPDVQKAVDYIFTNNMQKSTGSTMYTCMLNENGGVESDLTVSVCASGEGSACDPTFGDSKEGFYLAIGGGNTTHTKAHILNLIEDNKWQVELADESNNMAMISVQGPRSRELLQQITDADLSNDKFPFSTHKIAIVAGYKVRLLRLTFVGELGWELHIPSEAAVPLYRAIMEVGSKYGIMDAGYRAIDSLSIEKGYRHWHADLRPDDTPLESALGFTCKLKGSTNFQGRSALEEQKVRGLQKRIACFTIDDQVPLLGLEMILRNGKPAGFIRRGEYAFSLGKSMGWGYVTNPEGENVSVKWIREGTYQLERMGERLDCECFTKSPFDPDNKRIK